MLYASADTQKGRMFMIRVLVVEDQKIMQKYFEYILLQDTEFRHVQTVADADTADVTDAEEALDGDDEYDFGDIDFTIKIYFEKLVVE